jgi:superfamily II DNA or RNA helicase
MEKIEIGKKLYGYQQEDLNQIFERFQNCPGDYNLLYQLPTGGGKTVIFSEIARRYIEETGKKVLILTHRIELSRQTSNMLTEFGVKNKVINSTIKTLPDKNDFMCFVAMVETLNNRLNDEMITLEEVGLVIIDEAHYNSFRKLFSFFEKCFILGVTATPLSSNISLPMKDSYEELIVGNPIQSLIDNGFLAKAITYSFDVGLSSLKIGINGDYSIKSSEILYSNSVMQSKLLQAYEQKAKGKKTLIFNAGINTSRHVYETFFDAGYDVRHLDNANTKQQRAAILEWFKNKPDAILTSVGILTTGFDEPTIDTIILNRATRSLSLYFQMIGRGSRIIPGKSKFDVIDLGNNVARFGFWSSPVDWQKIFRSPNYFLENIVSDDAIERRFKYIMPDEIRQRFNKTETLEFDIDKENDRVLAEGLQTAIVLDRSIEQHANMIVENSEDFVEALSLVRLLEADIADRIRRYCYNICKSTQNFKAWAEEDYKKKLKLSISNKM